VRVEEESVKKL